MTVILSVPIGGSRTFIYSSFHGPAKIDAYPPIGPPLMQIYNGGQPWRIWTYRPGYSELEVEVASFNNPRGWSLTVETVQVWLNRRGDLADSATLTISIPSTALPDRYHFRPWSVYPSYPAHVPESGGPGSDVTIGIPLVEYPDQAPQDPPVTPGYPMDDYELEIVTYSDSSSSTSSSSRSSFSSSSNTSSLSSTSSSQSSQSSQSSSSSRSSSSSSQSSETSSSSSSSGDCWPPPLPVVTQNNLTSFVVTAPTDVPPGVILQLQVRLDGESDWNDAGMPVGAGGVVTVDQLDSCTGYWVRWSQIG